MGSTSRLCVSLWLSVCGCASTEGPRPGDAFNPGMVVRDLSIADVGAPPDFAPPPDLVPPCMITGAPCNTGQLGVCAAGHQGCAGSGSTCVQDVNPTVENCFNNLDDDCNGAVNNGCPTAVTLGTPRALPAQGGGGGGPASVRCPSNTWVVRTQFYFDFADETASGVHIYCAAPTLQRGASSYSITLGGELDGGGWTGAIANYQGDVNCGTASLAAGWRTRGQASAYVYGMGMDCATGTLTLSAANTLSASFVPNGVGTYWSYPYPAFFQVDCAPGEVLVGYDGRSGSWMDQLQPICAPLVFN